MSREDAIRVEGRVVEVLPHRAFRVELPNGHRLLGFGLRRMIVGMSVGLKLSQTFLDFRAQGVRPVRRSRSGRQQTGTVSHAPGPGKEALSR